MTGGKGKSVEDSCGGENRLCFLEPPRWWQKVVPLVYLPPDSFLGTLLEPNSGDHWYY